MTSIWDLAQQTFKEVPANWRQELEVMEAAFTPDQLTEAFRRAQERKARTLKYVRTICEELRDQAAVPIAPAKSERERLLCDGCGLPAWVDNMVPQQGRGLCRDCADPATATSHEAGVGQDGPHVHILTVNEQYIPPARHGNKGERSLCTVADAATLGEIAHLEASALSWWYRQPSSYHYPIIHAAIANRLCELGVEPPERPPEQVLTATGEKVAAYWEPKS